jgi:hypothetical protein
VIVLRALSFDDSPHVVDQWYSQFAMDEDVRAGLDVLMLYLRTQHREGWIRPRYDTLRDANGVGELRFKVKRINYRPLGYFGPGRNEFTFLYFATKTDKYDPRNAIQFAMDRKDVVVADPNRSVIVKGRWNQ